MSRLCRLSWLVVCVAGVGMPSTARAQYLFDMFTPYSTSYTPYTASYSGYYSVPYSAGYGAYASSAGCCSTCRSYPTSCGACCDPCGCSPCVGGCGIGCATGNCATGNCGTSVSSGSLKPVPDSNSTNGTSNGSNIESRLQAIEKALKITPPRARTYGEPDDFNSVPPRRPASSAAPSRPRDSNDEFQSPIPGTGTGTDGEMFPENTPADKSEPGASFKIPLPADTGSDTVIPSKKPATVAPIDEKKPEAAPADSKTTTLPLDQRVTSRPVSPRERLAIPVGFAKPAVASARKSPAPRLHVDAQPQAISVARH